MLCQTGRGLRTSPVFFLCAAWMPQAGYFRHEQGKEWEGRSEGGQANLTTNPNLDSRSHSYDRVKEVNLHMRFLHTKQKHVLGDFAVTLPLTLNFPHSPPLQSLFQLYFCKSLPNFLLDDMFASCLMYVLNYKIFPGSCNNVLNSEISPSLPAKMNFIWPIFPSTPRLPLQSCLISLYSAFHPAPLHLPASLVFSSASLRPSFTYSVKIISKVSLLQRNRQCKNTPKTKLFDLQCCVCVLFWGTYFK